MRIVGFTDRFFAEHQGQGVDCVQSEILHGIDVPCMRSTMVYIYTLSAHVLFCRVRFPSLKSRSGVIEAGTQSHNGSSEKPVSPFTSIYIFYMDPYTGAYNLLEEFSTLCVVRADLSPLSGSAQPKQGKNGKVRIFQYSMF
jgi:hypothetical protein